MFDGRPLSMSHGRASEHASEGWPGHPRLCRIRHRKT
jgi:hypothetical protein